MKRIITLSLLTALVLCGCQVVEISEAIPTQSPEAEVFTAIIEGDSETGTKTYIDNNGNVRWKQGDLASIFEGSTTNKQYKVSDDSDGKTTAVLQPVKVTGYVAGTALDHNVAYYPYYSFITIEKSELGETEYNLNGVTLPQTQHYAENSFGNGAFPMAAVTTSTTDRNLKFKNVLGGIKLMIKGTATITSISITNNNTAATAALCGSAVVRVSNEGTPSVLLNRITPSSNKRTVTLDCGDGVQLNAETATPFIIALPPTTMPNGFTVVITDSNGGHMEITTTLEQTINRSRLLKMPDITYEGVIDYVDLGLPSGLKWAAWNLGAHVPEEVGDYYAWGETEPYYSSLDPLTWKDGKSAGYDWASYQWCNGGSVLLTKYNTIGSCGPVVDNKTILEPADDPVRAKWGGNWRMPSAGEWSELIACCTWTWTTQNGAYGYLVTGTNGNSIFIPAAGYIYGTHYVDDFTIGFYWTSSLYQRGPEFAWGVHIQSDGVNTDYYYRSDGQAVRPVTDEDVRVSVSGVTLSQNAITLEVDATASLSATVAPANATQRSVIWSSSNTSVAFVDYTGVVTAVGAGSATITATTYDGGFTDSCTVTVTEPATGTINGYEWVNLGLPSGLKWATCNVGSSAPEDYGDYFAWGDAETYYSSLDPLTWKYGKNGYNWESYEWGDGNVFGKYNTDRLHGVVDNLTTLELADDAARANWGGDWRMPTDDDWYELNAECTGEWTTRNEVNGMLVTGPNGNSIFLPAAGTRVGESLINVGGGGYYWSSTLMEDEPAKAFIFFIGSEDHYRSGSSRYFGHTVRPVVQLND